MQRKSLAFLVSFIVASSVLAGQNVCSNTGAISNSVTQMDLGKEESAKFRFCNSFPVAKMYENSVITSDGGIDNQREMSGFLVDDLIEIPACSCYDIRIQRDPDEQLEKKVGFFWLKITELEPSTSGSDAVGHVIAIRLATMPVFTYGNSSTDQANITAGFDGKRLIVKNSGDRLGRVVAIKVDGQKIDLANKIFVFPGEKVDLTKNIPINLAEVIGSKKQIQLIDWIGQEVPII